MSVHSEEVGRLREQVSVHSLDIRKFSFSQRTVNEWNILSAHCVGEVVLIYLKI